LTVSHTYVKSGQRTNWCDVTLTIRRAA
jgi:hypothetical protein